MRGTIYLLALVVLATPAKADDAEMRCKAILEKAKAQYRVTPNPILKQFIAETIENCRRAHKCFPLEKCQHSDPLDDKRS
jgi:hypothetical protein